MEIKRLGLVCIIVLLSQLLLVEIDAQKEGKKDKERKDKTQVDDDRKSAKNEEKKQAGANQNDKGQKSKGGKGSSPQGKFSSKEKADCTWAASEADTVSLKVECKKGGESFWCVFAGNPAACPQFEANQKSFWKQISRALKKQKNICQDPKAVLKSKECKKAPQGAHLSLLGSSLVETAQTKQKKTHHGKKPPQPAEGTDVSKTEASDVSNECIEDAETVDQKKVAEDYCGESWSSLCTFFFSMLQNKKC